MEKDRISSFKNRGNLKQDELRRRREDAAVEIRKQQREESFSKRRNLQLVSNGTASDSEEETTSPSVNSLVYILNHHDIFIHTCIVAKGFTVSHSRRSFF